MFNYLMPRKNYITTGDLWNDFFTPAFSNPVRYMKTDVTETENEYLLDIELPGYGKEDVSISLEDGYLTVQAVKKQQNDSEKKNYVTRERYYGTVSRSWYVGNIDKNQIKATFKDGILNVSVPKKELPEEERKNYITID